MGPAGSRRITRAPRYSGAVLRGASRFAYGTVTLCGAGFHRASATLGSCARRRSYNPGRGHKTAPVWANARSLATTCAIIVIFSSSGYLDVSVPRVRPPEILRCGGIAPAGFPHSDIRGSQGICPSPRLFAACHVLRRLREPQASPMRPFILSLFLQARDARQCRPPGASRTSARSLSLDRSFNSISRFDSLLFAFPTCQ